MNFNTNFNNSCCGQREHRCWQNPFFCRPVCPKPPRRPNCCNNWDNCFCWNNCCKREWNNNCNCREKREFNEFDGNYDFNFDNNNFYGNVNNNYPEEFGENSRQFDDMEGFEDRNFERKETRRPNCQPSFRPCCNNNCRCNNNCCCRNAACILAGCILGKICR